MSDCTVDDSSFDPSDWDDWNNVQPPSINPLWKRTAQVFGSTLLLVIGCYAAYSCRKKRAFVPLSTGFLEPVSIPEPPEPPTPITIPLPPGPRRSSLSNPRPTPPLHPPKRVSFSEPEVSDDQKKAIHDLITKIGTSSYWELAKQRELMSGLEKKIEDLHPFHFLGTIFGTELKKEMPKIFNDWIKRYNFINGIDKGMTLHQATLTIHLEWFSKQVRSTPGQIGPFVKTSNWRGLVEHLIVVASTAEPTEQTSPA
ncbi:MAG: hypothetical protein KGJ02_05925 [Verrucomicrobiota bacterium]|nr:hypothetical protein [Verrucomicrobiota bacterium]